MALDLLWPRSASHHSIIGYMPSATTFDRTKVRHANPTQSDRMLVMLGACGIGERQRGMHSNMMARQPAMSNVMLHSKQQANSENGNKYKQW